MTDLSLREQIARTVAAQCHEKSEGGWEPSITSSIGMADAIIELIKGAVKPLEWNKIDEVNAWSRCRYHSGTYLIEHRKHGDHFDLWVGANATKATRFDTLQDAKVAAQADYSRRILATLGVK